MNQNNLSKKILKYHWYALICFVLLIILSIVISYIYKKKINDVFILFISIYTIFYSVFWILFSSEIKKLESIIINYSNRIEQMQKNYSLLKKGELNIIKIEYNDHLNKLASFKRNLEDINYGLRIFVIFSAIVKIIEQFILKS